MLQNDITSSYSDNFAFFFIAENHLKQIIITY